MNIILGIIYLLAALPNTNVASESNLSVFVLLRNYICCLCGFWAQKIKRYVFAKEKFQTREAKSSKISENSNEVLSLKKNNRDPNYPSLFDRRLARSNAGEIKNKLETERAKLKLDFSIIELARQRYVHPKVISMEYIDMNCKPEFKFGRPIKKLEENSEK